MVPQPLVSVIMPCHNAAKYLREALESVLNQSYTNLQIILIDDGSTDETAEIIRTYHDPRIEYYLQENRGQCAASNTGIEKAKGDYIKFFDADDVMNPEHIEAQLSRLNGSTTALASCAWGRFYDNNYLSAKFIPETVWKDMQPLDWLKTNLRQNYDMMGGWLWLIPAPLLKKSGGWDERLSLNNDFEFSIRLVLNAEMILFAGDAKMYYRTNPYQSSSWVMDYKNIKAGILSTDLGCSYLLKADPSEETRLICANRYQEWVYRAYPVYKNIVEELEDKINQFGGSDRKTDGGWVWKILCSIMGWKKAVRLKNILKKAGYKKLPFN